jgi:N-acetylglucosamine kinase-like BadF-type ATPase
MPDFYLGVDGGQSSTTALIADESGRILGRGDGGPCNHVRAPEARTKFFAAVGDCLKQACDEAGLDASAIHFAAACLGFSGGAEDKETYARELIRSAKYKITHDAEIALTGATEGQPGIIVIAGTGSMAFGRNAGGETARAGGWGYIFGDEGGAFDLVRQALRAALQYDEGWGPDTALRNRLLEATGARDANDLLHRFYTDEFPRAKVAAFAPLVTTAALSGDEAAKRILRGAAAQLASLAEGVHQNVFGKFEAVPVCYIGGVFRSEPIRVNFAADLQRAISCTASAPRYSPAAGAVLEALRLNENESRLSNVPESEK